MEFKKTDWTAIVVIMLATFGCFSYTLQFGLISDDNDLFGGAFRVSSLRDLIAFFQGGGWNAVIGGKADASIYRPMSSVYVALLNGLFGANPSLLHAASVLLHAANSAIFFLILRSVLAKASVLPLVFGALFFALHPAHTESIAWIAAVTDLLTTFFILLAFLCYVQGTPEDGIRSQGWAFALFMVALFSKETAILFPVVLAVYDTCAKRFSWQRFCLFLSGSVFYYACRQLALSGAHNPGMTIGNLDITKTAYALKFIAAYLRQLLYPVDLPFFFFSPTENYLARANLLLFGLLLILFLAFTLPRRKTAWAAAWFLLFLLPPLALAYSTVPLFAVRHLYLPSAGFVLVVTWALDFLYRQQPLVVSCCVTVLLLAFAVGSYTEGQAFRNDLSLGEKILESSPNSVKGHLFIASHYSTANDFARSLQSYQQAYEAAQTLAEKSTTAYALGLFLAKNDRLVDGQAYLSKALEFDSSNSHVHNALGNIAMMQNHPQQAIIHYQEAVNTNRDNFEAIYNLATACEISGMHGDALKYYHLFLQQAPRKLFGDLFPHAEEFVANDRSQKTGVRMQ